MIASAFICMLVAASPHEAMLYGDGATAASALAAKLRGAWRVETAAPPSADPKLYTEGAAALAAGRKAYDGLLFEEAEPQLRMAVERLQSAPLTPAQWPALWSAYLWLGLTYEAMGDEVKRDAALDALALLDLDPAIAGAELPPAFRDRVRQRLSSRTVKTGSLRVESAPPGADVFINGRPRGKTPLRVDGLPGGEHSVAFAMPGRVSWQRRVAVRAGFGVGAEATPDLVEARLAPEAGAAAETLVARLREGVPVTEAERSAVAAESTAAGRQAVIVAVQRQDGIWTLAVFADGRHKGPVRGATWGAIVATWETWLTSGPQTPVARQSPAPAVKPGDAKRTWLWVGIGTLVTGGATAAAIAASRRESPDGRRTGEAVVRW